MTSGRAPGDHRRKLGTFGERLVAEALKERGFEVLETNLRTRWGELDLVARRSEEIWFVEVKTRRSGSACEVSRRQQQRIASMASRFLQRYHVAYESIQFVVALVRFEQGQPRIEWIEQAFEAGF